MPGIHFIHADHDLISSETWDSLLGPSLHDNTYVLENVYADSFARFASTRYPEYPVRTVETKEYLIVMEGRLYGLSDDAVRADLEALASWLFADKENNEDALRTWLLDHDGDFVIAVQHKVSDDWSLLNDALGRLPLYHYQGKEFHIVSREIGFINRLVGITAADPLGVAQYLTFGYPLGLRTLWSDVNRLAPGSLLKWRRGTAHAERRLLHGFDFNDTAMQITPQEAAEELVPLLESACKHRADPSGHNLLSLSGGLDSRTVAVGLQRAGCAFKAATFEQSSNANAADVRIAEELAKRLQLDWMKFSLPSPTGREVQEILRLKSGLVNISQAYDVHYFERLLSKHNRSTVHFSGDGGDKVLPDLHPGRGFRSTRSLAEYIIDRHRLMSLREVERLTKVPQGALAAELTKLLDAYPEVSLPAKYIHFMIYERGIHWLFEGEDRNRCAFWSCTPFYSLPFFRATMRLPQDSKKNHLLYGEFLKQLSPIAAGIEDAGKGRAPSEPAYRRKIALAAWIARYNELRRLVAALVRQVPTYSPNDSVVQGLRQLLESGEILPALLDPDEVQRLADHPALINRTAFDNLFTLAADPSGDRGTNSSLAAFGDSQF